MRWPNVQPDGRLAASRMDGIVLTLPVRANRRRASSAPTTVPWRLCLSGQSDQQPLYRFPERITPFLVNPSWRPSARICVLNPDWLASMPRPASQNFGPVLGPTHSTAAPQRDSPSNGAHPYKWRACVFHQGAARFFTRQAIRTALPQRNATTRRQ